MERKLHLINNWQLGGSHPPLIIAGNCAIESRTIALQTARFLKTLTTELGLPFCFKASFDKANRTSWQSFRSIGFTTALAVIKEIKESEQLAILSDIHETCQIAEVAEVADVLQIPAFLCRQTDLIMQAAATGRVLNIKKGQFLSPSQLAPLVEKARSTGNHKVMLTERGTMFGYGNLIVDMGVLTHMQKLEVPVIFDASHAVQRPGDGLAYNNVITGGERDLIWPLTRAAMAIGVQGIFCEVHPEPAHALSDSATSLDFAEAEHFFKQIIRFHRCLNAFYGEGKL